MKYFHKIQDRKDVFSMLCGTGERGIDLSLDAESSSIIHDALADPCNGLCCTIRFVAQDC